MAKRIAVAENCWASYTYVRRTNWLQCTEGHVLKSDGRRTDGGHDTNASITSFLSLIISVANSSYFLVESSQK